MSTNHHLNEVDNNQFHEWALYKDNDTDLWIRIKDYDQCGVFHILLVSCQASNDG